MAESQSRFSIIEELTNKKSVTEDKSNELKTEIESKKLDQKRWEANVLLQRERNKEDLVFLETKNNREIETLTGRLKQLDLAIKTIQDISDKEKS